MTVSQYLDNLNSRFKAGNSTEHTFRGELENLIQSLVPGIVATNEPTRIACGAPDYIITRKNIPVGYIEAKDIDADLKNKNYNEQFERYKSSLENLIFTNYIDFHFYKSGKFVTSVFIGEIDGKKVIPLPDKFSEFENLVKDFCSYVGQTIKSAQKLSEMMAGKARMLANVIDNALTSDEKTAENSTLLEQMTAFKDILIHDIKPKEFSDIYAQTVAYGMFAARLHDPSIDSFSRMEAAELIPKSNPFLRKLFGYIAGPDIDERIKWIVDALADIFRATDVKALLKNFGSATQQNDPIIHFYETFLAEYDPKLRKARGVWYTPEPVVNFIVRAVDDILKTEFNLPEGLADRSKIKIKVNEQDKKVERDFHKVQILDPATGTGTFLAEVIKQVYKKFEGQQGVWSNYVEEHLIPRLNGFELLMASYAMAHLKLDLLLTETGYKPKESKTQQRLKIFLTNSLEEAHPDIDGGFAGWLSKEANEANNIKRNTPVMVVTGNPPYSISSSNKSEWIENLLQDYKKDLFEQNIQPLSDDYIKFIRLGQYFINKNGEGILAYITNNSFVDGIIHKKMRENLLKIFDKIFILDLHGNSKKKEKTQDGLRDQNVFDIQQGVSINIMVKTSKTNNQIGSLFHSDLYGDRDTKYKFLFEKDLASIKFNKIKTDTPDYFFTSKVFNDSESYSLGFKADEFFPVHISGIQTHDDENLVSDKPFKENNQIYYFRPFDIRFINYDLDKVERHRFSVMKNMLSLKNYSLLISRQAITEKFGFFVGKGLNDRNYTGVAGQYGAGLTFPLYIYKNNEEQESLYQEERFPNLNPEIVKQIAEKLGLKFTNEKENKKNTFAPIDILDYIYAVLHSPSYREKYKEFLKIDFPRVPYPKDEKTFWELVKLGSELREIHLLESKIVNKFITTFPIDGNNEVGKIRYETGKVWINETQYFAQVPQTAWGFYIGGYQPAQKWLKDRKERTLNFDDIQHYQKIIVALSETDRIMKEIDKLKVE